MKRREAHTYLKREAKISRNKGQEQEACRSLSPLSPKIAVYPRLWKDDLEMRKSKVLTQSG